MSKKDYEEILGCIIMVIILAVVVIILTSCNLIRASENNKIEDGNNITVYESQVDHNTVIPSANVLSNNEKWTEEEAYMLAKIAMAEAEGESLETKVLVILTVLNRVQSKEAYFPDTIEEVIFQNRNGVYQFTPVANGRWDNIEPNDECWEAVRIVSQLDYDISCGALYFEACKGESWHSRNLEFICQSDNTRFYK